MSNERWNSPYDHTMVYSLFKKNFTELNDTYWAHYPASTTIMKKAKSEIEAKNLRPLDFFVVHDKDDRRVASSYGKWCNDYEDYLNYARLSFLMLLNSCFETYLRTIVSLAIESKPGIMIRCKDAVDGVSLLKSDPGYSSLQDNNYQFRNAVESVVKGTWNSRNKNYVRLFSYSPLTADDIRTLDQLRTLRNRVGHFFARDDTAYSAPLFPEYQRAERLKHDTLIKYFALVESVVTRIDGHLQSEYIGSYDIIRYYSDCARKGKIKGVNTDEKARSFQIILGTEGPKPVSKEFCTNLIKSCGLEEFKQSKN